MATVSDVIVLVSAVIAAAFLLYFSARLLHHKKNMHTKCAGWVGCFVFLALFMRLLSLSNPDFSIISDLFLLITVITIILLVHHLQKSVYSVPQSPWEVTKSLHGKKSSLNKFECYKFLRHKVPRGRFSGVTRLVAASRPKKLR